MKKRSFETEATHFGERFGEKGSMNVPIYLSSTFRQKRAGDWEEFTYTRVNNPTEEALRKSIATLENGAYSVVFSSGLAAIDAVMELLGPGDHFISTADIYGGTDRLFGAIAPKRALELTYVETDSLEAIKAAIKPNTKLVYIETPSNPQLKITDLRALSRFTKERGLLLAVDNSLATPYFQRPLDLGADIVIHSLSKYISGHTNVVGGAVVANDKKILEDIKFNHKAFGAVPSPFDCFLTMLGIKTLALRMERHQANALRIAAHLKKHKRIKQVTYPGLPDHPQHALAKSQMSGFSGICTFDMDGDQNIAKKFLENLELFGIAVSFGSTTSLVECPSIMSHKDMKREERLRRGFTDTLVRFSIGIEKDEDLIEDIENALRIAFGD